jgi:hypothetical protein
MPLRWWAFPSPPEGGAMTIETVTETFETATEPYPIAAYEGLANVWWQDGP